MSTLVALASDEMGGAEQLREKLYDFRRRELITPADATGAASGALAGKLGDVGIDASFIAEARETIEPGHSALFLLARDVQRECIEQATEAVHCGSIERNRSPEDGTRLRGNLAAGEVSG